MGPWELERFHRRTEDWENLIGEEEAEEEWSTRGEKRGCHLYSGDRRETMPHQSYAW